MMEFFRDIEWGAARLWPWVVAVLALALPVLVWAYLKTPVAKRWRLLASGLKLGALIERDGRLIPLNELSVPPMITRHLTSWSVYSSTSSSSAPSLNNKVSPGLTS